jgi:alkylhydroperoxidase family enzyme
VALPAVNDPNIALAQHATTSEISGMVKETYMARIRPLNPADVGPEEADLLQGFQQRRGNIPNMFRTMAYRAEIARTAAAHLSAVFDTGTVDTRLKEMLAVRVSQINDCDY